MKLTYSISSEKIIIDYSSFYCETADKLLRSKPFAHVLHRYLDKLADKKASVYTYFLASYDEPDFGRLHGDLIAALRLLTNHDADEIQHLSTHYGNILRNRQVIYEFVEGLYDYWRSFERYIFLSAPKTKFRTRDSIHHMQFIKSNETLRQLILRTYRTICENLIDTPFRVYRQLPAGAHIGLMNQHIKWDCPSQFVWLERIPLIRLALLEPPVIFNTKMNTRSGLFKEVSQNPLDEVEINPDDWFCYPAKIGKLFAFAYFHKRFMALGASLSNLFELANFDEIYEKRPDIILLFGAEPLQFTDEGTIFYHDKRNKIMIGYIVGSDNVDYFGYMKKMLLTLHNVIMIERDSLPVHGAMVSIQLKNDLNANIIIIGDSGAGKSETLEAFRILAKEYISDMNIIFDDMGSIEYKNESFLAYGTEIGAFLRLDDLQPGYAFEQLDRSIFMNAHLTNARLIVPVTTYRKITLGTPIDFFLYANNYESVSENKPAIELFTSHKNALEVFNRGRRMAKGTTSERGLVESYFANPFGAPQRSNKHEDLAESFLQKMFKKKIAVGQMRTQLGIEGMEMKGPQIAAKALFKLMAERPK